MFDETIEGVTLIPVSILTEVRESNFENVDILSGKIPGIISSRHNTRL